MPQSRSHLPPNSSMNTTITTWEDLHLDCIHTIFSKLNLTDRTISIPFVSKSWFQSSSHPFLHQTLDFHLLHPNPTFLKLAMSLSNGAATELRFSPFSPPSIEVLSTACPSLKTLFLPRINFDDETPFLDLIPKWTHLECLQMESKPSNLGEIVKRIGVNCGMFRWLKLRGTIERDDVMGIVNYLPGIRVLDLSGCRLRKEEAVMIVDGCRDLKRLIVRDCVGFDVDEEFQSRAAGIEVFEFEGCRGEEQFRSLIEQTHDLDYMLMNYGDCFEMWML